MCWCYESKPKACAARTNESILAMTLTLTFGQFNQDTALEMASSMVVMRVKCCNIQSSPALGRTYIYLVTWTCIHPVQRILTRVNTS